MGIKEWLFGSGKSKEIEADKECKIHHSVEKLASCCNCGGFVCVWCEEILFLNKNQSRGFLCANCFIKFQKIYHERMFPHATKQLAYYRIPCNNGRIIRLPPVMERRKRCQTDSKDEISVISKWYENSILHAKGNYLDVRNYLHLIKFMVLLTFKWVDSVY